MNYYKNVRMKYLCGGTSLFGSKLIINNFRSKGRIVSAVKRDEGYEIWISDKKIDEYKNVEEKGSGAAE